MNFKMLIINPGSTSTKIGVYEDDKEIFVESLTHSLEEIEKYDNIYDQFEFRKNLILNVLKEKGFEVKLLNAVVARGGLLKPIKGGTYTVSEKMLEDLKIGIQGEHACNLGAIIGNEIAKPIGIPAFIVDPVVVDEMEEVARISGMEGVKRKSIFHALNQKAVAKRYAKENHLKYEDLNLIVVHIGGGVSVGVHQKGRVVDVNNALDGEGPFSPERSGSVPIGELVKMCFSGEHSLEEIKKKIVGKGGIISYLGTNDVRIVEEKICSGDKKAELIKEAFIYQVSKEIGACATVLKGKVDSIILTGGISYSKSVTKKIIENVGFISPVTIYPGEDEMLALAEGGLRVLGGEEVAREYK
ncbi:butyrate kinase [Clostridium grantii]|uniref:Probable butyrate kinase n=1 Tax=Clostridium grantii DSM 8605 TaxID=1121316 RepID=A0A1M5TS78_9CLOT|nr:butyrate kinase [Clostridium grantii]SHH53665.1 butyrate kinase [Clostridium grantii DSM 8605]